MPAANLPTLEHHLEARLLELERLHQARPSLPDVPVRAGAGQRIDELLDEIAELQQEIMLSPAETLKDAAVKRRRLSVYLEDRESIPALLQLIPMIGKTPSQPERGFPTRART